MKDFIKAIGKDKFIHFGVCTLLTIILAVVLNIIGVELDKATSMAGLFTFLIGIGKECYDKYIKKTKFDVMDMFANILGIFASTSILTLF